MLIILFLKFRVIDLRFRVYLCLIMKLSFRILGFFIVVIIVLCLINFCFILNLNIVDFLVFNVLLFVKVSFKYVGCKIGWFVDGIVLYVL